MRRYRRLVLTDRAIPFLAAVVGLVALAGAVLVDYSAQQRAERLSAELAGLRHTLDLLGQQTEALASAAPPDSGAGEALAALDRRLAALEADWENRGETAALPAAPEGEAETAAAREIDPNLPTTDCIPAGTRFMVTTQDGFPICQSTITIKAVSISGEAVALDNGVALVPGTPTQLPGGACTASLLSTDAAGFAELRVDCR